MAMTHSKTVEELENIKVFQRKSDKFKILFILLPLSLEFPPVSNLLI